MGINDLSDDLCKIFRYHLSQRIVRQTFYQKSAFGEVLKLFNHCEEISQKKIGYTVPLTLSCGNDKKMKLVERHGAHVRMSAFKMKLAIVDSNSPLL